MAKGTRGGKRVSGIPAGMTRSTYDRYRADGFSDKEIAGIWKSTKAMRAQIKSNQERRKSEGSREITSSTYKSAQRRTKKRVDSWFRR